MPRRHTIFGGAFILAVTLFTAAARADVKLPAVFSDNMVLQREKPIAVWGWADDGEDISVKLGGAEVKTIAANGRWKVYLPRQKAGGPLDLSVKGRNEIRLHNVLVGEVWIASGQSNME